MTFALPYRPERIKEFKELLAATQPGDGFWRVFSARLGSAYLNGLSTEIRGGDSQGGAWKEKTRKQREIDEAVLETMANTAADHPLKPLGMTAFAVRERCREMWEQTQGASL